MEFKNIQSKLETINSWNNTLAAKAKIVYPKNISDLKFLLKKLKKNKVNYLIRTGACSYDGKSISPNLNTLVISLKHFNKILNIDIKKKTIKVEAGALISDVIKKVKKLNLTLFSVPGGEKISIGGAISANTIGKDSSPLISSFGDALVSLEVLNHDGKIKRINNYDLRKYVGAFGMQGLILNAILKVKKIKSQNLILSTKILNNLSEIEKELKSKADYHYIQVDPFFREEHFAISFKANSAYQKEYIYKSISLKHFKIEELIFKFFGLFKNYFTWKIFYKFFFILNKKDMKLVDIHNFHYGSKYKHFIPLICNKGLLDYEILIKNNFIGSMEKLIFLLQNNKIYPIYIIVKKLYKSKKKFFYQFNDDGYAVAIAIDKSHADKKKFQHFKAYIKKNKFKFNLSKTDEKFVKTKKGNNNLFLSLYKKMILSKNGISRKRA